MSGLMRTYFLLQMVFDSLAGVLRAPCTRAGVALGVMVRVSDAVASMAVSAAGPTAEWLASGAAAAAV